MDLEAMEKRLRALEDLEEIKKLQRRYMQHHDRLEFDRIPDLFTDDAEVEVHDAVVVRRFIPLISSGRIIGALGGMVAEDEVSVW